MTRPRLFVVAPVYNEEENVPRLVGSFGELASRRPEFDCRFILVDDGSFDDTAGAARALALRSLEVLRYDVNRGPGYAFGTAFEHLAPLLADGDLVVTLEGDNTSRLEVLDAMLRRLDEGYDAVLASPYMYGGGIMHTSAHRMFMSHIANAFVKEFLGAHGLLTVSSFYRLYTADCLRRLQLSYGPRIVERTGFESMVELVMKMINLRMKISEVPMVLDTSLREGKSKLKLTRTALGYLSLGRRRRAWQRAAAGAVPE